MQITKSNKSLGTLLAKSESQVPLLGLVRNTYKTTTETNILRVTTQRRELVMYSPHHNLATSQILLSLLQQIKS